MMQNVKIVETNGELFNKIQRANSNNYRKMHGKPMSRKGTKLAIKVAKCK